MKTITLKEYKKKFKKKWKLHKEMENILVPDKEVAEKHYFDKDCALLIVDNLTEEYRHLTFMDVIDILDQQNTYIARLQKRKKNIEVWDLNNIKWLEKKTGQSFDLLNEVMNLESAYLKLIGVMNN
jgi:hypothetical protein